MGNQPITVLVVDDHTMIRKGIRALLSEYEDIQVVGEAANGLKAVELTHQLKPDVILIDLAMPVMDGIEAIIKIIANRPDQRILVLTGYTEDDKLFQAIKAGARGYLVKNAQPEELVQAIRNVYAGEPTIDPTLAWNYFSKMSGVEPTKQATDELSERELQVLRLLTQGKTDQEIAKELVLTDVTVRTHVSRILAKLGLKNRVQAALYGIRSGLVSLDEVSQMFGDSGEG